jgi:signal transduction histidine kinase
MVDITRTKTLELERRAAEQSRAEFFEVASHELRSPVTSILGFSATLLNLWDDLSDEDRIDSATRINRQARRLGELVEDLLTLSLVDDGRLATSIERLDLREVIEETVRHVYLGSEATIECAPGISVLADRRFLGQMLVNYLTNADRYGRPPIHVLAVVSDETAQVRVEDAGDGVPEAFVPKLFHRFARGENRTFPGSKSVGLGLSIVRDLAKIQNGRAWYEETKSGGACFCFSLPLAVNQA